MITKEQNNRAEDFNSAVRRLAVDIYSAVQDEHVEDWLRIDTKYGPMMLDPSAMPSEMAGRRVKEGFYTVFCRFLDAQHYEQAHKALGSNPFTGKYNFHECCFDNLEALDLLQKHFQRVAVE